MNNGILLLLILQQTASTLPENKDEFCSNIPSPRTIHCPYRHCTSGEPDCCQNLDSTGRCRTDIFRWIVIQDFIQHSFLPFDRSCINEVTLRWYRDCVPIITAVSAQTADISKKHEKISMELSEPSSFRSVDYLFLVETNCKTDSSVAEKVINIIHSLLESTADERVFHDVKTQVGLIIYSNEEKLEYIYARDFSSEFPSDVYSNMLAKITSKDCNTPFSSYRSVDAGLRVMTRMLGLLSKEDHFNRRIRLSNNKSVSFWHRPYSDLHVMTVLHPTRSQDAQHNNGDDDKRYIEHNINRLSDKLSSLNDYPVSLHLIFNQSNSAAVSFLGEPSLTVRYSDCSHFRKAPTLKALISAGLGDSLQALLISKGIEFQVHSLDDLNVACVLNISPSLSTTAGLSLSFLDRCLLVSNRGEFELYSDWYCSRLHGWTQKKKKKRKSRRSGHSDFEDAVPLSGNYGASHADLATSAVGAKESDEGVELSINKKLRRLKDTQKPNVVGHVRAVEWTHDKKFVEEILRGGEPVILTGTVVQTWKALQKWNMTYLSQKMDTKVLSSVKCTNNYLTFDPDYRSLLKLNISLPYSLVNMSTSHFFECVESTKACSDGFLGHYYFGTVPESLKKDVQPSHLLYHTDEDFEAAKQFIWVSSRGMITHAHFDQDYNFFVQLVGEKRFTLWTPEQHELMYVYPRVHPLWHKSRVNFRDVDIQQFPGFSRARGVQVKLGPGDMLYVPPYMWHYVETLSPSVSLSTWSHDYHLYDHMNAIYRHDHKFDLLQNRKGQMFVLRLFLDMMVHDLYGFNETSQFFARLLHNRFSGLEHFIPPSEDDHDICASSIPNKIPTCVHVHGYAKLDMEVIGRHFQALDQTVRDILFSDYVEEVTAQVVGVRKMLAFFRYCFLGQGYYVTDIESEEHALWDHSDSEPRET